MNDDTILREGRNCWRIRRAHRAAVLVDTAAYFAALADGARRAERSILILGWDFERRERLHRGPLPGDGLPDAMGAFFDALVRRRPGLRVHALIWDYAMIYALERDWFPAYHLDWRGHPRLRLHMDGRHPLGGSQHQKVVVIDDRVAFVGGIDLGKWRWDTPEHRADDPRRVTPDGEPYPPFHDLQMVVEGPVAASLGDLARERWRRATGETLEPPPRTASDPWPRDVEPDFRDVDVAIARTLPAYRDYPEVREAERLYLDAIDQALDAIYVENQYFTSGPLAAALARRLGADGGPDTVLVLPSRSGGWLEESTMDRLRSGICRELRAAAGDRGRLALYYPHIPGLGDKGVKVHAKLMVVDDRLLRLGSTNLTNRSMGLDSECDLAIEAGGRPEVARAILALRNRLLAEHLGVAPERVAAACGEHGRLVPAVEALRGDGRSLRPLPRDEAAEGEVLTLDLEVLDPERPVAPDVLVERYLPPESHPWGRRRVMGFVALVVALLALAAAWRWSPLGDLLRPEEVQGWLAAVDSGPLQMALVAVGFVVGGVLMLPLTLFIALAAVVFGPGWGFAVSLAGATASALTNYGIGHLVGRKAVQRIAGERVNRISRALARRGVLAVVTVRLVPVAPFGVVNVAAGASHIRFWDFLVGSVIGLVPGVLAVTLLAGGLHGALVQPHPIHLLMLALAVALVVAAGAGVRRWLRATRSPD